MKRYAILLALATTSMAADAPQKFIGVVHRSEPAGSSAATRCVVIPGPKFTLQTASEAWILTDEKRAARYAGRKVAVTGTVSDGNKLTIIGIAPAQ